MRSETLYYRQGSSDKVYVVVLRPGKYGWLVDFAYGRRGESLLSGTKTPNEVGLYEATRIYDGLIREKEGKGYVKGRPYGEPAKSSLVGGFTDDELMTKIDDEGFDYFFVHYVSPRKIKHYELRTLAERYRETRDAMIRVLAKYGYEEE